MYKCENCKTQKNTGADVYFVESAFLNFIPTCSEQCASVIKQREIDKLKDRLNKLENSEIKKERW